MPPQEHNVRVIGLDQLNNNVGLLIDRLNMFMTYFQPPVAEENREVTLDNLTWLIQHEVHLFIGMQDDKPYVRVMPVSGIPARTLNGPIDRSLARLRRESERLFGGGR